MSNKLAGIFACCTLLMIGSIVLLREMSFDLNTVLSACQYSILGAIIAGLFGFLIGKVLETANNPNKGNNYKNLKKSKSTRAKFNNIEGEDSNNIS